MAEVLFYHLTATPIEATLPDLLEKIAGARLARAGARRRRGRARLSRRPAVELPRRLLPAARPRRGRDDARQPILLTTGRDNANGADVLMLALGARAEVDEMAGFARACLLFDGADAAAVAPARADWRAVTAAGLPAKYWAQDGGRWVQKAAG